MDEPPLSGGVDIRPGPWGRLILQRVAELLDASDDVVGPTFPASGVREAGSAHTVPEGAR